jgi:hypothetical protein
VSHFALMALYAALVSAFFGTLLRHERRAIVRFAAKMFFIVMAASLAAAWLMYPLPL